MNKTLPCWLMCLLCSTSSLADQVESSDLLDLLQQDIQKYTDIATGTRQNVDYMPYVISVLTSNELQKLGVQTLREALNLVPGVDLSVGMAGIKNPVFRGSNPYALGQSKLLIDGVVVNDTLFGAYVQYLDMPIVLIQRIEVVRGPGSLTSHVNGYSGSVHVITRANRDDGLQKPDEVFVSAGSNDYGLGGFISSYKSDQLEITSDVYYQRHDQSLPVGVDRFGNSGNTDQSLRNYHLAFNASYRDLTLKSRLAKNDSGVSYGQAFSLTDDPTDFLEVDNNYLELAYKLDVSTGINADLVLGYFDEWRELQNKVMPDGSMLMMPPPPTMLPDGRYFLVDYVEQTFYGRIELNITRLDGHNITTGIHLSQTKLDKNQAKISDDDLQTFTEFNLLDTIDRDLASVYVDDLIDLDEKLSLQLGLKIDHYSDVDSQYSPRLAFVYRHNNENIYKLMYTNAYREPSWREQYLTRPAFFRSTLDINEESVDAYEVSYIRKLDIQSYFKINAYYLNNEDQIHAQNSTNTFQNSGSNELYGFEVEYKTQFANSDQLYINYSYVDGQNVFDVLASSAQHMSKAYYVHNLKDSVALSGIFSFVDQKDRIEGDARQPVDSYFKFDLSLGYSYEPAGVQAQVMLKNLFDKTYYLPSPANTYPDDFQQEGRTLLFSLKKSF